MFTKLLFWFSFCFILYTYLGYPCLLFVWSKLLQRRVSKRSLSPEPLVSVIISSRNEEAHIEKRILNLLEQDYPLEKMEIIVVSDGSTDATADIVRRFITGAIKPSFSGWDGESGLKLITIDVTKGKAHSLNVAVVQATGEYLVLTDSRQVFHRSAIRELLGNFADPTVGCVSGELVFHEDSVTAIKTEMGLYWNFEKWVRRMESDIDSVPGVTGAIYAIRKSLFTPVPENTILDDVFLPMMVVFQGYRTIFDAKAIAYDSISKNFSMERSRKVRTLVGNYQLVRILPQLLSPATNRLFFRFISHKLFRLFVPFFFIMFIFTSATVGELFYQFVFFSTLFVLILAAFDKWLSPVPWAARLSKAVRSFASLNYFAFLAFLALFQRNRKIW